MIRIKIDGTTAADLRRAADDINQRMAELLQEVGTHVLSLSRLDFEKKSRGGVGAGGITWKPLETSTERRKGRRGRKPGKTKAGKRRKRDRVTGAKVGKSQIGVDTGMLRNSSEPGYKGPDGKGGNVLELSDHQVTVGYGRTYSGYFDEDRPLMPDPIPQEWTDSVDAIFNKWIGDIFGRVN